MQTRNYARSESLFEEEPCGRRTFLKGAVGSCALTAASYSRVLGANERIGVGLIGYGLIGKKHVTTFRQLSDVALVGVADCHRGRVEEGRAACGTRSVGYQDFRRLLDDKTVDSVIVATPDHWHSLMTMLACTAGKDVYVEKPLTLFVREAEWIESVAARTKRVVQVGTQQRSGLHYQTVHQLLRDGQLGKITSVKMSATRNVMPGFGSPPDGSPPAELDWDMWLGPAPARSYNPNRGLYHFRWFWDTSGGQMTNLGAHHLDIVDWCIGLDGLQQVASVGGRFALQDNGETPDTQDALFHCGDYSIAFTMREAAKGERPTFGLTFYGTRGSLGIDRFGFKIIPDPDLPPSQQIPGIKEGHPIGGPTAIATDGQVALRTQAMEVANGNSDDQYLAHARNFIDCMRSRKTPISDLASAHRTSVACHLANLSLRLGRSLSWDWETKRIHRDDEANAMLVRPYRAPWDKVLASLTSG